MRPLRSAAAILPFVLAAAALAQSTLDKTYSVNGKAALNVEVDDASVRVNACTCRTVHIHVDGNGNDLGKFRVTEMQGGDGIHFALKHPEEHGFFSTGWHTRSPQVTIETPTDTQLTVRSGDGSLTVAGTRGSADMHTGNGSIQLTGASGAIRTTTGNGSVHISEAEGTLYATTGNGAMTIDGRFSQIDAHSGDGGIHITLLPGSKLSASSHITAGNGSIGLQVPRDLQAEVQATTGNGSIANDLPLQMTVSGGRNNIHGTMNGGGPTLRLQSGLGSIALSTR